MALHPTSDPPHRASVLQRSSLEVAYIPVFGVRLLAASKPLRPERDALKFPQVAHRSETNACMRRPIPGGNSSPAPSYVLPQAVPKALLPSRARLGRSLSALVDDHHGPVGSPDAPAYTRYVDRCQRAGIMLDRLLNVFS
jgi:hypothetical protein